MAYWGPQSDDCDFAFDCVGSYITHIGKVLLKDADTVIANQYPEQSILVSLRVIRMMWGAFPKHVACAFPRAEFERSQALFYKWVESAGRKLPKARMDAIVAEAESTFADCETMYHSGAE